MTVINNRRPRRNWSVDRSTNNSDTEALNISSEASSDIESAFNESIEVPRYVRRVRRVTRRVLYEDSRPTRSKEGKRKCRRLNNASELSTLVEEDEDDPRMIKLMDDYQSPLTRLMQNPSALSYWHQFVEMNEELQAQILNHYKKGKPLKSQVDGAILNKHEDVQGAKQDPFEKLSSKIKHSLKARKKLSLELIAQLEDHLLQSFILSCEKTYIFEPKTSFERLVLHAIAQYHSLSSENKSEKPKEYVVVVTKSENWMPVDVCFCQMVEKLRN